jgi:hypothetical protein
VLALAGRVQGGGEPIGPKAEERGHPYTQVIGMPGDVPEPAVEFVLALQFGFAKSRELFMDAWVTAEEAAHVLAPSALFRGERHSHIGT